MSTTQTAHTPGPWTLTAGRTIETAHGEFSLTYDRDRHGNPNFKNFCALDANAAHIVQCVNVHEELLEALKAAKAQLAELIEHTNTVNVMDNCMATYHEIERILAKAEGGQP